MSNQQIHRASNKAQYVQERKDLRKWKVYEQDPLEKGMNYIYIFMKKCLQLTFLNFYNIPGMILEVFGDEVRLKYGHPLAGQTITFSVEVLEARLATDKDVDLLKAKYQQ